jgi:NAD(P)-dependent dehydrogenase (short-subunit alcohol dehydrogenase family)
MPPTKVLITGANGGLGKECARQLAELDGVQKVYLGCRNKAKAEAAKTDLEASTGKTIYEIIIIDVSNLDSVREAVQNLPEPIDGLVLNAGGAGGLEPFAMSPYGVCNMMASNVLGHVLLVDLLLQEDKIVKGGSIVYSGSEGARGVPKMGMAKPELTSGSVEELTTICDGSIAKRDNDAAYCYIKLLAALWMSSMASKVPDVRFVTMSPGATTGTEIARDMPLAKRLMFGFMFKVMKLLGVSHGIEVGAKRYVDALADEEMFQSGVFYASKKSVSGPVGDQKEFNDIFANKEYQENASIAIQKFLK